MLDKKLSELGLSEQDVSQSFKDLYDLEYTRAEVIKALEGGIDRQLEYLVKVYYIDHEAAGTDSLSIIKVKK